MIVFLTQDTFVLQIYLSLSSADISKLEYCRYI